MKKGLFILLPVLIMGIFLAASCIRLEKQELKFKEAAIEGKEAENPEIEAIAETLDAKIEDIDNTGIEEAKEFPQEETETDSLKKYENPSKGIYAMEKSEPKEYLDIQDMKLRRTSRDKAEVKEFILVFRNIGNEDIMPIVVILFPKAYVEGAESTAEREFSLPLIKPGMKFMKSFPVGVYYHNIDYEKLISMKFYRKYETPRSYLGKKIKSFVPINALDSLEIKWT